MQIRTIALDRLWELLGEAARAGDGETTARLWALINGVERLNDLQVERLLEWLADRDEHAALLPARVCEQRRRPGPPR